MLRSSAVLLVLALLGCGGATVPEEDVVAGGRAPTTAGAPAAHDSAVTGSFGHESDTGTLNAITLTATSTNATFQFGCSDGTAPAIVPDAEGAFSVAGSLVAYDGEGTPTEALFSGTVDGDVVVLTVIDQANGTVITGPLRLTRGLAPKLLPGCI